MLPASSSAAATNKEKIEDLAIGMLRGNVDDGRSAPPVYLQRVLTVPECNEVYRETFWAFSCASEWGNLEAGTDLWIKPLSSPSLKTIPKSALWWANCCRARDSRSSCATAPMNWTVCWSDGASISLCSI